ncbi:hypothetical protein BAVI_05199 [Neobacillus vireti LMG 21834]|uniref:Uncharacterized protein n=1 Tax=Neobacillus vireti LMG 21834 TaxID=1131730 RepID=A0AB94IS53_9BACI|nr:hypothetical protein BAVI_05199 [Neobacillus vireti LMG 21834]
MRSFSKTFVFGYFNKVGEVTYVHECNLQSMKKIYIIFLTFILPILLGDVNLMGPKFKLQEKN